jgi:hypothetical protein
MSGEESKPQTVRGWGGGGELGFEDEVVGGEDEGGCEGGDNSDDSDDMCLLGPQPTSRNVGGVSCLLFGEGWEYRR